MSASWSLPGKRLAQSSRLLRRVSALGFGIVSRYATAFYA